MDKIQPREHINILNLPPNIHALLIKANICYLDEIKKMSTADLLNIEGFGGRKIQLLKSALHKNRVYLSDERAYRCDEIASQNELLISIERLNLSNRAVNVLQRAGIKNLLELISKKSSLIASYSGAGKKTYKEIVDCVHSLGLCFDDEVNDSSLTNQCCINEYIEKQNSKLELLKRKKELLKIKKIKLLEELDSINDQCDLIQRDINAIVYELDGFNKVLVKKID